MYTAKLYSEENWTAEVSEASASWLSISSENSGTNCSGMEFNFSAAPNETGRDRVGYITITTEKSKDNATIRFTQSAYDK